MKRLDKFLRSYRERLVLRVLENKHGAIFDIGCGDGSFLQSLSGHFQVRYGCDPAISEWGSEKAAPIQLVAEPFPAALRAIPDSVKFDVFTAMAVFEHLPPDELRQVALAVHNRLNHGGVLVVTVPSPVVDQLLHILMALRLIDGQEVHQHYGFRPSSLPGLMKPHLELVERGKFQMGLNNIFVFAVPRDCEVKACKPERQFWN